MSGALRDDLLEQQLEHYRAAVALELQHVFAGEGVGSGEVERDAVVDNLALRIAEVLVGGVAGRRDGADYALRDRRDPRSRDPHHADPARHLSGGDGGGPDARLIVLECFRQQIVDLGSALHTEAVNGARSLY